MSAPIRRTVQLRQLSAGLRLPVEDRRRRQRDRELWRLYPTDSVLYLRRCEDRAESEVAVQLDFVRDQPRPAMSADRVHHLRISRFLESAWELCAKGYTVDDLAAELEGLSRAFKRRNPYTHPMDPDRDVAEYHRKWRAERRAQLERYVAERLARGSENGCGDDPTTT